MSMKVGVVGARRRVQGIGEHVARHLASLGAEIVAIVGTSGPTVEEAAENLRRRYGLHVRGYLSLEEMLETESLDAVAICSPDRFHRRQLALALEAGVHALCEKPLVFEEGRDPVDDAGALAEGFSSAGKLLMVNHQWPYTLSSFARIHPDAILPDKPADRLEVTLSPDAAGAAMIPNSLPHALSLLLSLAPLGGKAENIRIDAGQGWEEPATAVDIRFDYRHHAGRTDVTVHLRRVSQQPRPAGYRINHRGVRRLIELPDYTMFFEDDKLLEGGRPENDESERVEAATPGEDSPPPRRVRIEDPLRLLLADFLKRAKNVPRPAPIDPMLIDRLRLLRDIHAAACMSL